MTFSLSRMALAENASNDSAQSPAWSTKPRALGDRGERVGEAARLTREHERRDCAQLGERGVELQRRRASRAAARPGARASCRATSAAGGTARRRWCWRVGAGLRRAHRYPLGPVGRACPPAPWLERARRRISSSWPWADRLLREQRGLDAVEEALEPADELRLREPQLRLGGRVAREGQHDLAELLAEIGGEHALELVERLLVDLARGGDGRRRRAGRGVPRRAWCAPSTRSGSAWWGWRSAPRSAPPPLRPPLRPPRSPRPPRPRRWWRGRRPTRAARARARSTGRVRSPCRRG